MEGTVVLDDYLIREYVNERIRLNESETGYQNKKAQWRECLAEGVTKMYKFLFNPAPAEKELLADLVKQQNPKVVLEEGAGNDELYKRIAGYPGVDIYYRSDISYTQLNRVQDPKVKNIVYDGMAHDIADGAVDVALSKCVLHHIDNGCAEGRERNRIDYLQEQRRLVKKGGKVITMDISDPYKGNLRSKFWHHLKHRAILGEEGHNFLTARETEELYRKAGFKNIESRTIETYKGTYFVVMGEK